MRIVSWLFSTLKSGGDEADDLDAVGPTPPLGVNGDKH
jgi:hypothetical protein